jgi:hypothetical protein
LKYLLILLLVFGVPALLIYLRLRPYLRAWREAMAMFREAQRGATLRDAGSAFPEPKAKSNEALLKCAACGQWSPSSRALKLGASSFCSGECLEKSGSRRR